MLTNLRRNVRAQLRSNPLFMRIYKRFFGHIRNRIYFAGLDVHEKMLADTLRTDAYYRAITKHVSQGDIVVDLGTGTGTLSFFAASKRPKKIYALDHSNIIEKARVVARNNDITGIEFIKTNSRRFRSHEPVDIIIHEQISYDLFSENMVANLIDLRDRVLKPGGKILPSKFEMFIEPVKLIDEHRVPLLWEQTIHGVSYATLRTMIKAEAGKQYYRRIIDPRDLDYFFK